MYTLAVRCHVCHSHSKQDKVEDIFNPWKTRKGLVFYVRGEKHLPRKTVYQKCEANVEMEKFQSHARDLMNRKTIFAYQIFGATHTIWVKYDILYAKD